MSKRFTESTKFRDKWYRKLTPLQKCIWEFAISECDHAGILDFDIEQMQFSIGAEISQSDLEVFQDKFIFLKEDLIFIPNFVLFQQKLKSFDDLNPQNKVHRSIIDEFEENNIFQILKNLEAPSKPLASPIDGAIVKVKVIGNGIGNSKGKEENENNFEKDCGEEPKADVIPFTPKEDPYVSPVIDYFNREYRKVYDGQSPTLLNPQREKILELNRELPDFKECLPDVLKALKGLYFEKIKFKPDVVWLLKESNFLSVKNGNWTNEEGEKELTNEELIAKVMREREEFKNG